MTTKEMFAQYGEEYFRDLETKKINELMALTGVIISTGGGAILRKENRYALLRNGYVIYLNRNISLLQNPEAFDELYNQRKDIYKVCCDLEYCNNSTQWNTLNYILKQIV